VRDGRVRRQPDPAHLHTCAVRRAVPGAVQLSGRGVRHHRAGADQPARKGPGDWRRWITVASHRRYRRQWPSGRASPRPIRGPADLSVVDGRLPR
jgi:hypothetical protein